jgi:chromosome segregation ATPase
MARQEVIYEEVEAAAISLQNDGEAVTIDAVREALGKGSPNTIKKHLTEWRASNVKPTEAPKAEIPDSILSDLQNWAQKFADEAGAARDALAESQSDMDALLKASEEFEDERDELLAQVASLTAARDEAQTLAAERADEIERLTTELADARQVAMDALVSKAKDRLAIDGKDAQLAELRTQLERNVTASAADSDARLAAEMELVGAVTARDSLANEVKDLRAQLAASLRDRSTLRAEVELVRGSQ